MHELHRALRALDLNLLHVLHVLLVERHVTRAARKLGLSQSATSHALARLRELYDDPLLVRNGSGLCLSTRALQLLPLLERGLRELAGTLDVGARFEPKSAKRSFSVSMDDYGQAVVLPHLLVRLRKEAPGVNLQVLPAQDQIAAIEAGAIDAAFSAAVPSGVESQLLFEDEFVCMMKKGSSHSKKRLTLEDYLARSHVVVAPFGGEGSIVDRELALLGHSRRVVLRVPNFLVLPSLLVDSDMINTGPRRTAQLFARRYALTLETPPVALPALKYHLIWHRRLARDPGHTWLRSLFAEIANG